MITLAIDTCDRRGSVAVRRHGVLLAARRHEGDVDYSSWLLPAVHNALWEAGSRLDELGLLGVATGPGSFTGLRVGLTTVKAWAEVYGTPLVGISRLEALANRGPAAAAYIAACYDAHRGQSFGGLFERQRTGLKLVEPEVVVEPGAFLDLVAKRCGTEAVRWVALDPELISSQKRWQERAAIGDELMPYTEGLADSVGELAEQRAGRQEFSDPIALDANYLRRSDAELYWKGNRKHA